MRWPEVLAYAVNRFPLERLLIKPPSNKQRLEELQEILSGAQAQSVEVAPEGLHEEMEHDDLKGYLEPRRQVHLAPSESGLSTEETVAYQNRELGKLLLRMERHYAQRLRINGVPCDCGSQKHLLDLESLCEETIAMVDNPDAYYRIIEWAKEVAPKSTDQAAKSGNHDNEYPVFSHQARDFRKEIMGSLEPSALFTRKVEDLPGSRFAPVVSDEERELIREKAHERIEEVLSHD